MPELPVLRKFLRFWERELDGKLHSVRVACATSAKAPVSCYAKVSLTLH